MERMAGALARCRQRGWLTEEPQWLRTTPLGQRFLNDVIAAFLD
jgi:oxygen-independent coproporphyrinogen-3 oxidase